MFVEIHLLQNFAPSNVNRDDTGAPKDCTFGGVRRARISSQCAKHAIRKYFAQAHLFGPEQLATRTKRIVTKLVEHFVDKGKDSEIAKRVVTTLLSSVDISVDEGDKTQYLLYLGSDEIAALAKLCDQHWNELDHYAVALKLLHEKEQAEKANDEKKEKKNRPGNAEELVLPNEVKKGVLAAIGSSRSVDLALFGRMLAHLPEKNIDAACQVAQAISVNEVSMETDFYTAIDDLKPDDTQGADMMGVIEFNSSCFYRYAKVDVSVLASALGGPVARNATVAFVHAMVAAIPTGKQNSMAAHNLPSYIRVMVRNKGQPWNLANAFARPVRAQRSGEQDLIQLAIGALEKHYEQLKRVYDGSEMKDVFPTTDLLANVFDDQSLSFSALLDQLGKAIEVTET